MIIEMFLDAIYSVFSATMVLDIPDLPESVQGYVDIAFDYITAGAGLLSNYVMLDYLMVLFGVLLAVDAGILIYHFVMWIIRKIPAAGMS